MSESGDSGPGRREVAHRLFAAEFDDSVFSYSESDEERAPNYVVTPTGARVNRLFVVGVLTELEQVNEEVLRARIVDPTGPFVVYAGQYQPEALAFLEAATPPLFVAVTGKARTFEPEDSDRVFTSVRPESISEVDAETRDRWVVQAAEQTVARVGRMASARQSGLSDDALQQALVAAGVSESDAAGAALALEYYDTTGDYLQAVRDLALNAARVVAGERDEAGTLSRSPGDGTDEPLSRLATMTLEAPGEASSAELVDDGMTDADGPKTPDADTAESATDAAEPADSATDAAEPAESATDAAEPAESATETAETGAASETADSATESTTEETETSDSPASSTAEAGAGSEATEPTDSTEAKEEPSKEANSDTGGEVTETDVTSEQTTEAEPASAEPAATSTDRDTDEGNSGTLGDFDSSGGGVSSDDAVTESDSAVDSPADEAETDDDVGDFDTEFDLDEDEREEIEAEYGTDFQSGTEVDDAGEADIETPDPEELAEAEAMDPDEAADAETEAEAAAVEESGEPAAPDEAEDVDLEDAVMAAMTDLNDGGGAEREAVITEVMESYGADREAVEDAVQDALMGGRCYEPDDDRLTPI